MELTCPHCGEKNSGAASAACAACGESLGGRKFERRVREHDGYAVGRRVLSLAPAWLLLIVVGFALALLLFSWMNRRGVASEGEAFRNEATNQSPTPDEGERVNNSGAKTPRRTTGGVATPAVNGTAQTAATPEPVSQGVAAAAEADSYSVQVGAFAELSQANEQVSRLRAAGFEARVAETGAATRFRFQVRSGLYATREEAARLASTLRAAGVAGETIIIEPERK